MPRISKRKESPVSAAAQGQSQIFYRAAIYARLSSDHDEKKNESIDTQIRIMEQHIENLVAGGERLELHDIYSDLGKTGSNFNRDEFMRMMQDIRMGAVNCVMVKDLSRFGRNYLEAGNYIEKIFPFLGIRFIAVSDGIDTALPDDENKKLAMNIKNLVNDMYAADFSKKAKIHLKQRRLRGSYVGGSTPYGYSHEWVVNDNGTRDKKLIIDQEARPVIEMMFDTFIREKEIAAVVRQLNKNRINPPRVYNETDQICCPEEKEFKGWHIPSVAGILGCVTYVGNLVQGRTRVANKGDVSHTKTQESEWVVIENSHEAIISKEIFDSAQAIISDIGRKVKNSNHLGGKVPLPENIFEDVLFCGLCGRKMSRISVTKELKNGNLKRDEYYACRSKNMESMGKTCDGIRIRKEMLSEALLSSIKVEFAAYLKPSKHYVEMNQEMGRQARMKYQEECRNISRKLSRMEADETESYACYRSGEWSQAQYLDIKQRNAGEAEALTKQQELAEQKLRRLDRAIEKQGRVVKNILRIGKSFVPDKEFIDGLIEKITVYPEKRIEIQYSFVNAMMEELL